MRRVIVRYKVKAERLEEHLGLVRRVFEQLAERNPTGFRYAAFRDADGLQFTHVAILETHENPLSTLPAFQAFLDGIKERCDEPPASTDAEQVGSYGF